MSRNSKRFVVAIVSSLSVLAATEYWYNYASNKNADTSVVQAEPIAVLDSSSNLVQRKQIKKIIWEIVTNNQTLFTGESIRTHDNSEASIKFLNSDTIINLEPNSLIILEKTSKGLALNFLKGNMFIDSKSSAASGLVIKSGKNTIDLNKGKLNLTKKNKKSNLNLEVFSGSAKLQQASGKLIDLNKDKTLNISGENIKVSKNNIDVTYPIAGEKVYIDLKKSPYLNIKWKKLDPKYKVYIKKGLRRTSLASYLKNKKSGNIGGINTRVKSGKIYIKLVAESSDPKLPKISSKTFPVDVISKVPPELLFPKNNKRYVSQKDTPEIKLNWANKAGLDNLVLEISTDKDFKSKIKNEDGSAISLSKNTFTKKMSLKSGEYYWRITGFITNNKNEAVSSSVHYFKLVNKLKLVPPMLLSPANLQTIPYSKAQNGVFFTWKSIPSINKYNLVIRDSSKKDSDSDLNFNSETNDFKYSELTPGTYLWAVSSMDKKGKSSKFSKFNKFNITEAPKINWASGDEPSDYLYYTDKPEAVLKWSLKSKKVTSWKVRYANDSSKLAGKQWTSLKTAALKANLPKDGVYYFEASAYNVKNQLLASSSVKQLNVSNKPLLPAPNYSPTTPLKLKTDKRGRLKVSWNEIDNAKEYVVNIKNEKGKVLANKTYKRNLASITRLKPGNYKISVRTVDKHSRQGPEGEVREISVPRTSNISAPIIKGLQIK